MATAPTLIAPDGEFPSPFSYEVPGSQAIEPVSVHARFDGSGAGGNFLACLSFYSQAGILLSRVFPQAAIVPGDVAGVTYAPFPGGLVSGGDGSGIRYGVINDGNWLFVNANDPAGGPGGQGVEFQTVAGTRVLDTSPNGITLQENGPSNIDITGVDSGGGPSNVRLNSQGGFVTIDATPAAPNLQGLSMLTSGELSIRSQGTLFQLAAEGAFIHMRVWPGFGLRVLEQNSGTEIMRLDYAGDLHLKTTATIIYDL